MSEEIKVMALLTHNDRPTALSKQVYLSNECESSPSCPADINGDGQVDISDFISFNSLFGQVCTDCPEDMNGDGTVDVSDFLLFNSAFGSACP